MEKKIPGWKDKILLTVRPLSTSSTVKQAMLRDLGSRDEEFVEVVRDVRRRLLEIGGVGDRDYEAIPIQGSGTYALEAVVASTMPPGGRMLIVMNGAEESPWKGMHGRGGLSGPSLLSAAC